MIGRLFRRRQPRELAVQIDYHYPPAPKSPPPPPPRPRTVAEMTDRQLLEEILDRVDRIAFPGKYWRGGPR